VEHVTHHVPTQDLALLVWKYLLIRFAHGHHRRTTKTKTKNPKIPYVKCQCVTLTILATWEAEISKITRANRTGESSGRVPA
jgi:hypothetical protein